MSGRVIVQGNVLPPFVPIYESFMLTFSGTFIPMELSIAEVQTINDKAQESSGNNKICKSSKKF